MTTTDDLLQRIYADPADIDLRRVYGDVLVEAGDPRGEFIQLQCAEKPPGRAQRGRANALLKKHVNQWLGPLAGIVRKKGLVFENGFLSRCTLDATISAHTKPKRRRQIEGLVGDPAWRTVTHIRSAPPWPESPMQSIYTHPSLTSLRSLVANTSSLVELCAGEHQRPIEVLHTCLAHPLGAPRFAAGEADFKDPQAAEALAHCTSLPRLHTLIATAFTADVRGIAGPVMKRLRHLRLDGAEWDRFGGKPWDRVAPWPALFRELELVVPTIELRCSSLGAENQERPDYRLIFRRADEGYTQLEAQIEVGRHQDEHTFAAALEKFAAMLTPIADELTTLRVTLLKRLKFEADFAPFQALADQCKRLTAFELP